MKKKTLALLLAAAFLLLIILLLRGHLGTQLLWQISRGGQWLLPLVFTAALLDSLNPCAFSVLLLTIAFLFSLGRLRTDIVKIGAVYIFGLFLVYLLIGLGLVQALHLFNTPHFMAKVGALLLILMGGLNLINHYFPTFPLKLQIPAAAHSPMARLMEKGSLPALFLLGALVGLCEFPCTGGPYLLVLGLLHDQATYWRGFLYLIFYNLVFVTPLVLILLLASDKTLLGKIDHWRKTETGRMRTFGGLAMIVLGLLILSL
jgi:cytochrome c biogenesis protein CcdA